jgi:predicted alpha/beta-fold hydrolase
MRLSSFPDFSPRLPWLGPDLQTLRNVLRGPALESTGGLERNRLLLPMRDGTGDRLVGYHVRPAALRDGAPLVVLVHGLGGSSDSAYIRASTTHLNSLGYPVLQLNLRGAGESRPSCSEQYHAGRSQDLEDVLAGLPEHDARNGIVVVGYSLGGNMVLKYAAESQRLRGVAAVSAPIDLEAASYCFLKPRNRFYHAHLLKSMKQEVLSAEQEISPTEQRALAALRSILEFDEQIVAPRNGYSGAIDYYAQNNARQFLSQIETPALVMHALDDPWIPSIMYTGFDWSRHRHLTALLPRRGGHVGFHSRGSRVPWHDRCLEVFLSELLR